jgi:hypothetical protein
MRSIRSFGYASLGVAVTAASLGWAALSPATAEDSGFWEVIQAQAGVRVTAPAPGFSAVLPSMLPAAPRPQIVRLPSPAVAKPSLPLDPNKRENPLASLMRDPTLRHGDIVMFPDGPRVFRGEPGSRHSLGDFAALAASRDVAPSTRKMVLAMPVGENGAWSADTRGRGRVAQQVSDVEATGSIGESPKKTVTVRTGRGDVRIIQVPN